MNMMYVEIRNMIRVAGCTHRSCDQTVNVYEGEKDIAKETEGY